MENSAIRKCTALYYHVDHAQEVHDIDSGWPVGVTWLVTYFGGGTGGRSPPRGGGPARMRGGGAEPPARARSARAAAGTLFLKKRKEVRHFVIQNGRRDAEPTWSVT